MMIPKLWLQQTIKSIVDLPHGSVFVKDTLDFDRVFQYRTTYAKGAMLLHMLRWKIGMKIFLPPYVII